LKIGLFFGSFNPIHTGHLMIANFAATHTDLESVWLVVSPHNPLKNKETLAPDRERLHLVRLAIEDNIKLQACDIEFGLPKPSYTIDTLTYLKEKYPQHEFHLIMGADALIGLPKWKNYELLLKNHSFYVYPRPGEDLSAWSQYANIKLLEAPQMLLSATQIRKYLKEKKSIKYLVPVQVEEYLTTSKFFN
jgi:nicotinate-nucleotide adenylyltransferase